MTLFLSPAYAMSCHHPEALVAPCTVLSGAPQAHVALARPSRQALPLVLHCQRQLCTGVTDYIKMDMHTNGIIDEIAPYIIGNTITDKQHHGGWLVLYKPNHRCLCWHSYVLKLCHTGLIHIDLNTGASLGIKICY